MAMFYMQYKGREKAAKVVEFVAKWLNLCLSTVYGHVCDSADDFKALVALKAS